MQSNYNPRTHNKGGNSSVATFNFKDIENPISLEILDSKELTNTLNKYPVIPFASNGKQTAHGLLNFLNSCRFISPTLGSCVESIKTYVLNGKLDINFQTDEDFDLGEDIIEVSKDVKLFFKDFVKSIGRRHSFSTISEKLYLSLKDNGNYYIELVHSTSLGVKSSHMFVHRSEDCMYGITANNLPKVILISPIWTEEYLRKNPPRVINVFPDYTLDGGVYRTIIHVKVGNFRWYGRPDWVGSWVNVYREFQDNEYLTKIAANQFTGQVFLEIEEDDVENDDPFNEEGAINDEGFDSLIDKIEANFTNNSKNPQTVLVTSRPYGSKPAFIYQFNPNTNENFYKVSSDLARQKIIESNQWSERLLGNAVASGWAQDAFIQELEVKEISILQHIRSKIEYGLNLVINEAIKYQDKKQFDNLGVNFKTSLERLKIESNDLNSMGGN